MIIGDTVKKTFKGLCSAGYTWDYKNSDSGVVEVKKIWGTLAGKMLVGASADESFEITAVGQGEATVTCYQSRNWETKDPIKTETYIINVE